MESPSKVVKKTFVHHEIQIDDIDLESRKVLLPSRDKHSGVDVPSGGSANRKPIFLEYFLSGGRGGLGGLKFYSVLFWISFRQI